MDSQTRSQWAICLDCHSLKRVDNIRLVYTCREGHFKELTYVSLIFMNMIFCDKE